MTNTLHFFSQGHCRFGSTDVSVTRIWVLGPPLPQGIDAEPFRASVSLLYAEDGERCLARLLCGGSETSAGPHLLPHWQLSPATPSHVQLTCRSWTFPGGEHTGPLGIQGQRPGASSSPDPRPRPWFPLPSPLGRSCKAGLETARVAPRTEEPYPHFTHWEAAQTRWVGDRPAGTRLLAPT